jgi:hypothetical protein
MERHESGCIRNPNRKCGFCAAYEQWGGEYQHQTTLAALIDVLQANGLEALKEAAGKCPGCVFAAIVQSRESQRKVEDARVKLLPRYEQFDTGWSPKEGWLFDEAYDFKAATVDFWGVVNEWKEEQMRSMR